MKKIIMFFCLIVVMVGIASCSSVKKDCQGNKHYRLKNGIYL
ncbi:MAG TPA: hypothetical protein VNR87_06635 [Flavisolibacter sp.]|nr:hypothetical protein [Flavisolibacter sp.]